MGWAKRLAGLRTQRPGQVGEFAAQKKLVARDRQARLEAMHSLRGLGHALQFAGSGLADLQRAQVFFYTARTATLGGALLLRAHSTQRRAILHKFL